ncbi:MAG: TetR/AcrR family transcriptional regulator [Nitrospirae bacterium]|nr:TetR/AcrR family transcriptional regulator [Nitrospirota bacterium]
MEKKDTKTRQAEIVAAAITLIGEAGVRGLTTAKLAGRLGMSEANLYRHFSGKQAILEAIVDEIGRVIMDRGSAFSRLSAAPDEKLRMILESHVREVKEKSGIPRLVFSEDVHLGNRMLREKLALRIKSYIAIIEEVLAEGVGKGVFRPDICVEDTAKTFLGMIQFAVLRWSLSGFTFSMEEEIARLWANFTRLIAV